MKHPGLKLTEWVLMHPQLSQDAKLVLGVTLAIDCRDARRRQLAEWLPMRHDNVIAAQNELEDAGIVTYRRPKALRHEDAVYKLDGKRIVGLRQEAEPNRRSGKVPNTVFLPGWLCAKLPQGRHGKVCLLYALLCIREQAMAGRSVLGDRVAAALLRDGTSDRSIAAARKLLVSKGLLEVLGKRRPPHMRLPLDVGTEQEFDARKALLLHNWKRAGDVLVVANPPQWAYILGLTMQLPDIGLERVIEVSAELDGGIPEGGTHRAQTLLAATRRVLDSTNPVGLTYELGGQQPTRSGANSELGTQTSSNHRLHAGSDPPLTNEDKVVLDRWLEERSHVREVDRPTKHELPNVKGGFLWATTAKWDRIEAALNLIETKKTLDHRLDVERLVVEQGYHAGQLLRWIEHRYDYLLPREEPTNLTDAQKQRRAEVQALLSRDLFGKTDEDEYAA
jgi:hypothetical protein